jgi:hypothetical protein|tara:strand:- start:6200 stop:6538 length:339 start_codon:yes stop_codon:yes gene_type:complete
MKYFAEVSPTNTVIRTVLADDTETVDSIKKMYGSSNFWFETSEALSGQRAAAGYTYDPSSGICYAPQPYPSWTLDSTNGSWVPPVPKPEDVGLELWQWDEDTQTWVDIGYKE